MTIELDFESFCDGLEQFSKKDTEYLEDHSTWYLKAYYNCLVEASISDTDTEKEEIRGIY